MENNMFLEEIKKLNIEIDDKKKEQLEIYYSMLVEKNKMINLTSIIKKEEVYLKHFYDSLTIVKICNLEENLYLCDVGSGAGFPGLVLKIVFPNLNVILLDSTEKKTKFLKEVIDNLKLEEVEVVCERAEDYAKKHREKFDIVTSRAVARLSTLAELCIPLVKIGGYFISMKGHDNNEVLESKECLATLGSHIEKIDKFYLPLENSERTLIKIIKDKETNQKYPREFKEIKKKAL